MGDDGADEPVTPPAPRRYNRPRRYAVAAPPTEPAVGPAPDSAAEVTRQNPAFAEAAGDYGRQQADVPGPPPGVAAPPPYPYPAAPAAAHTPEPAAAGPPPSGRRGTPSTRLLVLGAAVLVVLVVIGLIVGLSGGDDSSSRKPTSGQGSGLPAASTAVASSNAVPSSTAPAPGSTVAPGTTVAPGGPATATQVCDRLAVTAPFTTFVAQPHPAERMPASYVEPPNGVRLGVCVGTFRPGGGAGRGRFAYLAEYDRLAATEYATALKTLGWVLIPNLPQPTYRNNLATTVTLVQQGAALVTVVGTGR